MLVDNSVHGDSRVQKEARSAAAAGWDVTLIGCSPDGERHSWAIGQAEVLLLPTPRQRRRRHDFRSAPLRRPFAYNPVSPIAKFKKQRVKSAWANISSRRTLWRYEVKLGERSRLSYRFRDLAQLPRRVATSIWAGVVKFRLKQTAALKEARIDVASPIDNLTLKFWSAVGGNRAWRRLEPSLWDWDIAWADILDKMRPDLIHANDFRMLGVGARAKMRAALKGHEIQLVWDAHEFLPGLNQRTKSIRWLPGNILHEREHVRFADAIVTVSENLGELLINEHKLAEAPAVVLNAPSFDPGLDEGGEPVADLRAMCGIDAATPLMVFCGGVAPVRGVDTVVEGLPDLPEVHLALVSLPPGQKSTPFIDDLMVKARELGVADRVHVFPYVPHWQVTQFLAPADMAVTPLVHLPNHEIAMSNKFFEYSHAKLPLLTSDVRTMAEMVTRTGQGEVFKAKDPKDFVRAVRKVLEDPARYKAVYETPGMLEQWTWEAQAEILDEVYTKLLPAVPRPQAPAPVVPKPAGEALPDAASIGTSA
ncbi:glycosyltransferase family 4 protein [Phytomonospora endophytica]|nr:glycosyltransferase family 4 protein [Phytomonospora endophytica]GIG65433.1 hypothetical protein Pen01_17280 [Phytomonospora endophytica]